MKKQTGFTLIELLVTLIIMGIMAAIALPAMTKFMEGQRVKSALSGYTSALTFARNEAIRQNMPVVVCGASISVAGQLAGCANNTKSWSEGVFVFADVNQNLAYNSNADRNIRVFNSPNSGSNVAESNQVAINVSVHPLSGNSAQTNPVIQFLPNGQVVIDGVPNANYVAISMVSEGNSAFAAKSLLGPTGQVIPCSKQVKEDNVGNQVAQLCA